MSDRQPPEYGAYRDPSDPAPAGNTVGAPYSPGAPTYDPYRGASQPMAPVTPGESAGGYPPKLPGRGFPITLIVLGAVVTLLIAPIVAAVGAVSSFLSGVDPAVFDETKQVAASPNPSTLEVEGQSAILVILTDPSETDAQCTVTDPNGELVKQASAQTQNSTRILSYDGAQAGSYRVECVRADGAPATSMHVSVVDLGAIGKGTLIPAVVTVVIGLGMLIGGIVWLVVRNKRRREILQAMQARY